MTIQQLEYIVALDTYRHFVTAAEKCYVTQPTLTMQVKKLEESIGISIFDRKKSPIEPTVIGESIILKARSVLREVQQLKALVNDEKSQIEGEFRIGVIPTISPYLIPLFATKFAKEYPKTKLIIEDNSAQRTSSARGCPVQRAFQSLHLSGSFFCRKKTDNGKRSGECRRSLATAARALRKGSGS